ncbi:uncharacterized protein LOC131041175 isoform X1 [Cryptomeria japonica]|uniref:uncharacterized protein LOC131041175 isoform X1 n=1 Tax=Cryptomeria japonica TaxID=3369 RepID=UPI0027DA4EC1|nr:uncharacterized protein LOC131041175 isoform X1 [Cryptomeria japonica]
MDSLTVKVVAATWRVLFLLAFIFFSTKSMGSGTQSGAEKGASPPGILPNAGEFATRLGGRIVGHSANALAFQDKKSVVQVRKLRRRSPLVPPSPKPNGPVSYFRPIPPPPQQLRV